MVLRFTHVVLFISSHMYGLPSGSVFQQSDTSFSISCGASPLENICLPFPPENVWFSFWVVKSIFTGHKILYWQLDVFSFTTLKILFRCLLPSISLWEVTHYPNYSALCIFLVGGFKKVLFNFGSQAMAKYGVFKIYIYSDWRLFKF